MDHSIADDRAEDPTESMPLHMLLCPVAVHIAVFRARTSRAGNSNECSIAGRTDFDEISDAPCRHRGIACCQSDILPDVAWLICTASLQGFVGRDVADFSQLLGV